MASEDAGQRIHELEEEVERLREQQRELDDEVGILVQAERHFFEVERNLERQMARMARLNEFFIGVARCAGLDDALAAAARLLGRIYSLQLVTAVRLRSDGGTVAVTLEDTVEERRRCDDGAAFARAAGLVPHNQTILQQRATGAVLEFLRTIDDLVPSKSSGRISEGLEQVVLLLRDPRGETIAALVGTRPVGAPRAHFFRSPCEDDAPFLDIVINSVEASFDGIVMRHRLEVAARDLEDRVRDRTAELTHVNAQLENSVDTLRATQRELIEASRLAGMSEVATGVLHNVGNVLNSVNVSASLVGEGVSTLLDKKLERLTEMMSERPGPMSEAEVGRLTRYLEKLADTLAAEKAHVLDEAQQLVRNVAHIRNIVSTQQSFAKAAGVVEVCTAMELVDDVMTLNRETLAQRSVEVDVVVSEVPDLRVDRHKVLQILVNLVSNAIQAVTGAGRRIRVEAAESGGFVVFAVEDDGIGIAHGNLARVFAQGFTTRADGHGFGLHASACAARELGGELTVTSGGPGLGARFELRIPMSGANAA